MSITAHTRDATINEWAPRTLIDENGTIWRVAVSCMQGGELAVESVVLTSGQIEEWPVTDDAPCAIAVFEGDGTLTIEVVHAHGENHTEPDCFRDDDGAPYYATPDGWRETEWIAEYWDSGTEKYLYWGSYLTDEWARKALIRSELDGRIYREADGVNAFTEIVTVDDYR